MLLLNEIYENKNEIYQDLGYRQIRPEEREYLRQNGAPLNSSGSFWRIKNQPAVNDIVRETVMIEDFEEITVIDCGLSSEYKKKDPAIILDTTMAELAMEFFSTGNIDCIEKLFSYDNQPAIVERKQMNDDLSYFEHVLFGSDKISRPYISAYNPSAGTVTRMYKHNLKPKFYFSESYFNSSYVQTVVKKRINEYYHATDERDMWFVCNHDEVPTSQKNHCYYGRNANLLREKKYSHAFEINPYSYTLKEEEKIIRLTEVNGGYSICYEAGKENVQYEYSDNVPYFRMMDEVFHTHYKKINSEYAYKRNDVYIYCFTDIEKALSVKANMEESPIVFDDPIQMPELVKAKIPLECINENIAAMLPLEKYEVLGIEKDRYFQIIDIDNGCTFSSRQTVIDFMFPGRTLDRETLKFVDRNFDIPIGDSWVSPIHPCFIKGDSHKFDEFIKDRDPYFSTIFNSTATSFSIEVVEGAVVTKEGLIEVLEKDYQRIIRRAEGYIQHKTLYHNHVKNKYGNRNLVTTQDLFEGSKFGD